MSFKIEQGLFNLDFTDYHAILGVPVDADPKEIRKHYLKLARRLHPDSCVKESEEDRKRAAEFLSKLVNPAYEQLSNEKNYTEYLLLLKLKGQQALRQQETIMLGSELARRLASEPGEIDNAYRSAIRDLAEMQYQHLDQTAVLTGQISELNLIYLMRKATKGDFAPGAPAARPAASASPASSSTASTSASPAAARQPQPKPPQTRESILAAYLRRAQEFEGKQDYTSALKELRDALQLHPTNPVTHSRLGVVYLKANQPTMAKIHFRKALELNPQDAIAQEGLRRVDPTAAQQAQAKGAKAPDPKAAKPGAKGGDKPQSGGGLFGLFGGKKK